MNLIELNICLETLETLEREDKRIGEIIENSDNPITQARDYTYDTPIFDHEVEKELKELAEKWKETEEGIKYLEIIQEKYEIERRIELIHSLLINHVLTLDYKID